MPTQSKGKGKSKSTPQMGRTAAEAAARNRAAAAEAEDKRAERAAAAAAGRAGQLASQKAKAEEAAAKKAAEEAAAMKRPISPKPAASLFVRTPTKSNRAKLERRLRATANASTRAARRNAVSEGSKKQESYLKKIENKKEQQQKKAERRLAQAEEKKRLSALQKSQFQALLQSRNAPKPVATQNYTETFTAKNLNNLNKKVEDSVDWDKEFNKVDSQGLNLRKKIKDWAIQCGYDLEHVTTSRNGYVMLEFTEDIHFTFHSSNEGIIGTRKEVDRSSKGAFHAQKKSENKLIRYITKSSDPFYFQKSQVQTRQAFAQFNDEEKKFIDGVFSIINEAKVKGVEAKGGRRRTRKLRR
jgi:hypothetical protein